MVQALTQQHGKGSHVRGSSSPPRGMTRCKEKLRKGRERTTDNLFLCPYKCAEASRVLLSGFR